MAKANWLQGTSAAFRLIIATSWLAPDSWHKNQEEAIREAIGAGPDWTVYLRLVDRHRIPALSWAALKRVPGLAIPESTRKGLQERSDACRIQAVRHSLMLASVLKAFNQAKISVMPFKGPILSAELYGDVALRQSKDLDIAVPQEDIPRAQACLENLGWRLEISQHQSLTPRQLESFWRFECNIVFVRPLEGGHLELHWRHLWETPDHATARWARCIPSVWQGCSYLAMNSIDQVLYLCSHGGRHAWFRAKWLGDLACIHAQGCVNWETTLDEARSTGQERTLLAGLLLLKEAYGLSLPDLPGNPYKDLPSFLIDSPLRALLVAQEPGAGALDLLRETVRWNIHDLLALPQKSWRESLAARFYSLLDYEALHLPDYLFWAYAPLRPVLWAWRNLSRIWAR
jgi:hypothetical protein